MKKGLSRKPLSERLLGTEPGAIATAQCVMEGIYELGLAVDLRDLKPRLRMPTELGHCQWERTLPAVKREVLQLSFKIGRWVIWV